MATDITLARVRMNLATLKFLALSLSEYISDRPKLQASVSSLPQKQIKHAICPRQVLRIFAPYPVCAVIGLSFAVTLSQLFSSCYLMTVIILLCLHKLFLPPHR